MRSSLQVFAGIVLAIAVPFTFLALVALARDPQQALATDAQILVSLIGIMLFAGILWVLSDIAAALLAKPASTEARPIKHPREFIAS
jgi:predicted branched-subunit amino acid permease